MLSFKYIWLLGTEKICHSKRNHNLRVEKVKHGDVVIVMAAIGLAGVRRVVLEIRQHQRVAAGIFCLHAVYHLLRIVSCMVRVAFLST